MSSCVQYYGTVLTVAESVAKQFNSPPKQQNAVLCAHLVSSVGTYVAPRVQYRTVLNSILNPISTCLQFLYANLSLVFARFHAKIIPWGHHSQDFVELGFFESDGEEEDYRYDEEDDESLYS